MTALVLPAWGKVETYPNLTVLKLCWRGTESSVLDKLLGDSPCSQHLASQVFK